LVDREAAGSRAAKMALEMAQQLFILFADTFHPFIPFAHLKTLFSTFTPCATMTDFPQVPPATIDLKCVVCGPPHSGKTALLTRFKDGYYRPTPTSTATTEAARFTSKTTCDSKKSRVDCSRFRLCDTSGLSFHSLAPIFVQDAETILLCFDVNDRSSFVALESYHDAVLAALGSAPVFLAVAANKCEQGDYREVPRREAERFATKIDAIYMETSALSGSNVNALFTEIAARVREQRREASSVSMSVSSEMSGKKEPRGGASGVGQKAGSLCACGEAAESVCSLM
jgi:small GTP-binding protein